MRTRNRARTPAWTGDFEPTSGMRRFADACARREVKPTEAARCEAAKVSPATLARWRAREGFEEWLGAEVNRLAALRSWEVLEMLRRKALEEENVQAAKIWLQHIAARAEEQDPAPRTFAEIARMADEEERRIEEEERRARAEQEEAEIRALKSFTSAKLPADEQQPAGEGSPAGTTDGAPRHSEPSVPCADSPPRAIVCAPVQSGATPCRPTQAEAGTACADAGASSSSPADAPPILSREERWLRRVERANGFVGNAWPFRSARRAAVR